MAKAPKLRLLKPALKPLGPQLKPATDRRYSSPDYKRWYKTAKWQRLRQVILVRDNYTCQMCGRVLGARGEAHIDHIQAHRGDAALFWAEDNLQVLCAPCHLSVKQREEKRDKCHRVACEEGWPE